MSLLGYVLLLTAALCSTVEPSADGSCKRPERMVEAELVGDWDDESYPGGTQAVYQCRPGYTRYGTIKKTCTQGQWQFFGKRGECRKKSCGHPGDLPFGTFELTEEDSFVFGAVVTYTCEEGYRMTSKVNYRKCTATGWSNYLPECEGRSCPPIEATENLNVISTSYDEEYSVGQVVRFDCKIPNLKLNGPSEIFCTSEGRWNLDPPTCTEIKCNRPIVEKGSVNNPGKHVFNNNEMIQITCNEGYRPNKNGESTCTKDDWLPKPSCTEITCNPPQVPKGSVDAKKAVYKFGEGIDVKCDDGYVLQPEPDRRRICTINGWAPPPNCVSKKCDKPHINNGYLYRYYWFPKYPGTEIEYRCNANYLTLEKAIGGWMECTNLGWNPEPKCLRQCSYQVAYFQNAELENLQLNYLEGEKVNFKCKPPFRTPEGQTSGTRTCLPDGEFTTAKCSITCTAPRLLNGEYKQNKKEFVNEEYLQYTCNKGYMTERHNLLSTAQCINGEWAEIPKCIPITCELGSSSYLDKDVIPYTCTSREKRPKSDLVQCFNYGWGPPMICQDIECTIPATSDLTLSPHLETYKANKQVSFSCKDGFRLVGAKKCTCTEKGWNPQLPKCQKENPGLTDTTDAPPDVEMPVDPDSVAPTSDPKDKTVKRKKCARAHNPKNSEIEDLKEAYYSNDEATITCNRGFKMYGSATIRCIDGKWEQPPECYGETACRSPPRIKNGDLTTESKRGKYVTDDSVKYSCEPGFHMSGSNEITCVGGQWSGSPECTEDSCDKAPEVLHATVKEERIYKHGESAEFTCDNNYGFSGGDSAKCVKGKWMNIPRCVVTSCNSPPAVPNSRNNGQNKKTFESGDKVTYTCNNGYSLEKSLTGEAKCENTEWINVPACRKIGEQCGPPPTVQFGDIIGIRKNSYKSNEFVEYKCPNYHLLKGNKIVRCLNGVWEEAPICLEPCTAKEKSMEENNIKLKWEDKKKLYSTHGDVTEFMCKSGYESLANTKMRIICEHGKLDYPKCFAIGFCVLQQSKMISNNVYYNASTVVENGQTIKFQCYDEMTPEAGLEAKCTSGIMQYPKCTAARSCEAPEILNGYLKTPKESYDSGHYVEFECMKDYVKSITTSPKCEKGQWTDQPICYSPCKVSSEDLTGSNIQLLSPDINKSYTHGTELEVSCKSGFKRPNQQTFFIECSDGKFKHPRCFSGQTCRMDQDNLDGNNLELDEFHNNEVYYEVGETIKFKCKKGFSHRDHQPTGTCTKEKLTYPKCEAESSV